MTRNRAIVALVTLTLLPALFGSTEQVSAEQPSHQDFYRVWARTDRGVDSGEIERTWMWGPEVISGELTEPYVDSPVGQRRVQYFDKSRMEITDPAIDPNAEWYVTNGLLVVEMTSGNVQVGDDVFMPLGDPAEINVAGDPDGDDAPTYASVAAARDLDARETGGLITEVLDRNGSVSDDSAFGEYNVTTAYFVPETGHAVAAPFWDFMQSEGQIWNGDEYEPGKLFTNPFYATGFPIIEAYWTTVEVGGTAHDVLLQCFERRCLTYTPSNPEGWQVEAGNVGQHYHRWRYDELGFGSQVEFPPELENLPTTTITTASGSQVQIRLEVAATGQTRQCGLMHRMTMPEDRGMLFVFQGDESGGFWNRNTFIPLNLAWISADDFILALTDMDNATFGEPQDPTTYDPGVPYRYVIEANQGWFPAHGVEVGDTIDLSAAVAAGDTNSNHLCQYLGF